MSNRSKNRSNTAVLASLGITLAVTLGGAAEAGTRAASRVAVDLVKGEARGALAAEHPDGADIGCRVTTSGIEGTDTRTDCRAVDDLGNSLSCTSSRESFARVARALPSFGFLLFRVDGEGQCTFMQSRVGSLYLP